jgi:hypothetical protein
VKNDAEWYSERITRYLMENRNAYPLWNSPPSALDTIYPNATNYRTGMVLDRNRRMGISNLDYPYPYGQFGACNDC